MIVGPYTLILIVYAIKTFFTRFTTKAELHLAFNLPIRSLSRNRIQRAKEAFFCINFELPSNKIEV